MVERAFHKRQVLGSIPSKLMEATVSYGNFPIPVAESAIEMASASMWDGQA